MTTIVNDYTALTNGESTWNGFGVVGQSAIVTYSFDDALDPYNQFTPEVTASWEPLSEEERALAREAIAAFDDACGLTFIEVESGMGDIRYGALDVDAFEAEAFAYFPFVQMDETFWSFPSTTNELGGGDLFGRAGVDIYAGIFWHELGHAVGLSHVTDAERQWSLEMQADPTQTVMMSRGDTIRSLSSYDIQALQYYYGTDEAEGSHLASWNWNPGSQVLTQTGLGTAQTIRGIYGKDVIFGQGGDDLVRAESGDDYVDGGKGNDRINGDIGNDTMIGGRGIDQIYGNVGDDTIVIKGSDDAGETYSGGDGVDTFLLKGRAIDIDLRDDTVDSMDYMTFGGHGAGSVATAHMRLDQMTGEGWYLSIISGTAGSEQLAIDIISETSVNLGYLIFDNFSGSGDLVSILGNGNAESVSGTVVNDRILGNGGNDTLSGMEGNDTLQGGSGADFLEGGAGRDTLNGGAGRDTFEYLAGGGRDTVTDFADNVDTLWLDDGLWSGSLTTEAVIATFAKVTADGVLFNFGNGQTLLIQGLADSASLIDDVLFI